MPILTTHTLLGTSWGGANWAEVLTAFGTVLIGLGAFAAAAGAILAARSLRESERARHSALVIEMARRWDDPALVAIRRSLVDVTPQQFRKQYLKTKKKNSKRFYKLQLLANFFEDFGVLVNENCLRIELVDTTVGNSVISFWETWSLAIAAARESDPGSGLYDNWESLYKKIRILNLKKEFDAASK